MTEQNHTNVKTIFALSMLHFTADFLEQEALFTGEIIVFTMEAIAKPFVIPECLYREYGFSSS
ncbi:MAG: hypothetical protein M0P74_10015 [Syntrophales bacterium]|nr:hypothetical protein [Syntrophales bacterium]